MTIGENIRRIRKEKRLTQKRLGELCEPNVSESTIRKYELGILNPKIETVRKIAKALNVDVWELIEFNTIESDDFDDWRQVKTKVDSIVGMLAMLREIYGNVEEKTVYGEAGGETPYYMIGNKDKFVLYEGDIETLINTTKSTIQPIIDRLKDTRQEDEIIDDIKKEIAEIEQTLRDTNN